MSLVNEKVTLNKIYMGQNENHSKLFDRIKVVETYYNTKTKRIKEKESLVVIPSQALKKYQAVLTFE